MSVKLIFMQKKITAAVRKSLRDSGRIHLSGHLQSIEALHVADGLGQDLSRLHGGHLSARLGQIAKLPKPCLQEGSRKLFVIIFFFAQSGSQENLLDTCLVYSTW